MMKIIVLLMALAVTTLLVAWENGPVPPPETTPAVIEDTTPPPALAKENSQAGGASALVHPGPGDRLVYQADEQGNIIPDFSSCGYMGGGVAIPDAAVRVTLKPAATGDDGERIQAALDKAGHLSADRKGLRGAVLLKQGAWRVEGSLNIPSGVVLRGEGQNADGTCIIATGTKSRTLISLSGSGDRGTKETGQSILDERVPIGTRRLRVAKPHAFHVGETVLVTRPATAAWIHAIGMDRIVPQAAGGTKQWEAGEYDMAFERTVAAVDAQGITLDVPMVTALEKSFGGGRVAAYRPGNRCVQAGVERLRLVSEYQIGKETSDESHAAYGVAFGKAQDCWLREVTVLHFIMGCVNASGDARRITVQDCASLDPVSQITGGRRYPFSASGSQILMQRCYSRHGRHDYVTGARVPGPNAFVDCLAERCHSDCGPHQRWALGILYDNIVCGALRVQDRGSMGSGHGWAGANHVLWNCTAAIVCQQPPTAQNWAIGCTGSKSRPAHERPEGVWESWGTPVMPRSLYLCQLQDRLGKTAVQAVTIPEQLNGSISELLHNRYGGEPEYPGRSSLSKKKAKHKAATKNEP